MNRVTTFMSNDDMQYHARMREWQLNRTQNQIASQSRIGNLRDDPAAAAHSTRYKSLLTRMHRYSENIEYAQSRYQETQGYMDETASLLHRARELAVQGANGTYTASDLRVMATEVNEILNQLAQVANARGADGSMLFSGDRTQTEPFRAVQGRIAGFDGEVITDVRYLGTVNRNQTEIGEGVHMPLNVPGNEVFWAENQQVYSSVDAIDYQVLEDTSIFVDGTEVALRAGDNIYAVMDKINASGVAVKAHLDPIQRSLVMETTSPHQLWLQDDPGGSVLQDLGILGERGNRPPNNYDPTARVFGGSMFDMLIRLRDDLISGNHVDAGGGGVAAMDAAMENITAQLGRLGSYESRLRIAYRRNEYEIPVITARNSREVDVDLTDAITELRSLEYTHQAALGAASRVITPTLLDFLR